MGQVALAGVVVIGPELNSGSFPAAETTIALISKTSDYVVSSPAGLMKVASDSAYVPMPGVGTNGPVTKGKFLYVRSSDPVTLRMTNVSGSSTTTCVTKLDGLLVQEFPDGSELVLLEVEGTATVEYLVAGQS